MKTHITVIDNVKHKFDIFSIKENIEYKILPQYMRKDYS